MNVPFADESLDVAVCAQVYEHVPDASLMLEELHRVLVPGGTVFFSGPNLLFPIEPHYHLPFLHWLPRPMAGALLRWTGKGDRYYEKPVTLWSLRGLTQAFEVQDISVEVMRRYGAPQHRLLQLLLQRVPDAVWKLLTPLLPNYNWILYKPEP